MCLRLCKTKVSKLTSNLSLFLFQPSGTYPLSPHLPFSCRPTSCSAYLPRWPICPPFSLSPSHRHSNPHLLGTSHGCRTPPPPLHPSISSTKSANQCVVAHSRHHLTSSRKQKVHRAFMVGLHHRSSTVVPRPFAYPSSQYKRRTRAPDALRTSLPASLSRAQRSRHRSLEAVRAPPESISFLAASPSPRSPPVLPELSFKVRMPSCSFSCDCLCLLSSSRARWS